MSAKDKSVNITLFQPQIPQNTGNIGRACVGFKANLHLIEPLGFDLSDKQVKRAGLDYWPHLNLKQHQGWNEWKSTVPDLSRVFVFSTKGSVPFYDISFQGGDYFLFGQETKGLPEEIHKELSSQLVTIPFPGKVRSFNLSNTVAMALSEYYRQMRI